MSVPPGTRVATSTTCISNIVASFQVADERLSKRTQSLLPHPPPLATDEHGLALGLFQRTLLFCGG